MPACSGIVARHRPERWLGMLRKPVPAWTGIRTMGVIIHKVDAGNGNLDQCLTWTRHRIGALDILQHLAAAGAVCHDSFHRLPPILNDRSIICQKKGYRSALSAMSARLVT